MYAIHSEHDIRYIIGNITGKIIVGSKSDQLNESGSGFRQQK